MSGDLKAPLLPYMEDVSIMRSPDNLDCSFKPELLVLWFVDVLFQ